MTANVGYPPAHDPDQVGRYPMMCHSGGGIRFSRVLEYRLWIGRRGCDAEMMCLAEAEEAMDAQRKLLSTVDKGSEIRYVHLVALVEQDWYWTEVTDDYKGRCYRFKNDDRYYRKVQKRRRTEWQLPWLLQPEPEIVECTVRE